MSESLFSQEQLPQILECRRFCVKPETEGNVILSKRYVNHYELDYNLTGGRRITVDDKEYAVEAGSIVFRHPGQMCASRGPYDMILLTFDWEDAKVGGLVRNGSRSPRSEKECRLSLPTVFLPEHGREILAVYQRLSIVWQQAGRQQLVRLLLTKLLHLVSADAASCALLTQEKETAVDQVLHEIAGHYMEPIRLDDLAARVHMSKHYLIRIFKKEPGTTPGEWILATRLEQAKRLLRYTTIPVAEVAALCGFDSSSYFCRRFRMAYSLSPQAYRNEKKIV